MNCPFCGSTSSKSDYPPPRGYALILTGLALLFAATLINPQVWQAQYLSEIGKIRLFGALLAAYGAFHLFRHENRFCTVCGGKFRGGRHQQQPVPNFVERFAERFGADPAGNPVSAAGAAREVRINPNTPLEPIINCLKFKDSFHRANAAKNLRQLTGQDFGEDYEAWRNWWSENKAAYKAAKRKATAPTKPEEKGTSHAG